MGYYSTIVIGFDKQVLARDLITGEIPLLIKKQKFQTLGSDSAVYVELFDHRWDSQIPEIKAILEWFDKLHPEEFGAIRMGDNTDDIEEWGDPSQFDICCVRYIDHPCRK